MIKKPTITASAANLAGTAWLAAPVKDSGVFETLEPEEVADSPAGGVVGLAGLLENQSELGFIGGRVVGGRE